MRANDGDVRALDALSSTTCSLACDIDACLCDVSGFEAVRSLLSESLGTASLTRHQRSLWDAERHPTSLSAYSTAVPNAH
jgi:hypothetical protein